MTPVEITSLSHPGLEVFTSLTEAQLRNRLEPEKGIFIAESPKVIRVALDAGLEPLALLCERRHLTGDAADIIARCPLTPVYTGSRELLASLTGYTLTRGVLCAMRRPQPPALADVCRGARRVAVIDGVAALTFEQGACLHLRLFQTLHFGRRAADMKKQPEEKSGCYT